jgi:N utilization substance protein A
MSNPLQQTIEALAKEKGIEPDVVISAIEEAVATASRKYYKTGENLKTRFNTETGQVDLFALKTVVEDVTTPATEISINEAREMYRPLYGDEVANSIELGDEMEFPKPTEVLGRIAAQTAKQVIFQKVREAEREHVFAEYNERIGEVVNGTVKRFENGDIILEIGRIEAVLARKEQSRAESYTPGDRVRTVIKGVNRSAKGPQIVLSRTDPALLIKLFEQEVPEIYDGTVMIRGAVREAGDRAKVAVMSRERDVDPVGACVGMKGTRVQSIIRELRGEKIDIVEWSEDPVAFVTNGLSPAKVQRVSIVDDRERVMEVIVEDKQLSLAIGKKGQNVRLAAKLTGWRIDIKSEEEKRREVEAQFGELEVPAAEPTDSGDASDDLSADLSPEAADGEELAAKVEADSDSASAKAEAGEMSATADAGAEPGTEADLDEGEVSAADAEAGDESAAKAESAVPYTLPGIGEKTVRKLVDGGFATLEALTAATAEMLSEVPGIGEKTAQKILAAVRGEQAPAESDSN